MKARWVISTKTFHSIDTYRVEKMQVFEGVFCSDKTTKHNKLSIVDDRPNTFPNITSQTSIRHTESRLPAVGGHTQ